jgi:hypothetical protein
MRQETNPRVKAIWERLCDYELGHLQVALEAFKKFEKRDPEQILPDELPDPIPFASQREFVRETSAPRTWSRPSRSAPAGGRGIAHAPHGQAGRAPRVRKKRHAPLRRTDSQVQGAADA